MRRREFIKGIVGSGVTAWPFAGRAQQTGKMREIGFLSPGSETSFISDFFDALAELGWSEGKNVVVERRNAENRVERLPELAASWFTSTSTSSWQAERSGRSRPSGPPRPSQSS
jgi:putative ABC transport system substrate-binding protein